MLLASGNRRAVHQRSDWRDRAIPAPKVPRALAVWPQQRNKDIVVGGKSPDYDGELRRVEAREVR